MFLSYWRLPPGLAREHAINGLLSSIGILGGLLLFAGIGQ